MSTHEPVNWPSKHQPALEKLISAITNPPVMAYPDYTKPFILHTDASERGLGAAQYQKQDGQLRVIAYGSRSLTPAERNCHLHSSKHEFLALKWTITEQLRDYLYYAPHFTVYTDSNPLTYVLTTAKLNATGNRWVAELSDFHFTVKCRQGSANRDADSNVDQVRPTGMQIQMSTRFGQQGCRFKCRQGSANRDADSLFRNSCTKKVDLEWIKATVEGVNAQHKGEAVWLLSLSSQLHELKHIMGFKCNPLRQRTSMRYNEETMQLTQ